MVKVGNGGSTIRVECEIEGIDPQPTLFEFFERVLQHAAERLPLHLDMIDRVMIVSPDRFGAAVDSIRPGASHTNTETVVAAGKTFARRDGDRVVSDIVLQCSLFGDLAEVLGDPPTASDWGVVQEQALYVICHEFGHAQDHTLRNDDLEIPDPRPRPFSISETADYYGNILLSEYAACRNSASLMTDPLFDHELEEAGNRINESIETANYYLGHPDELTQRALAHVVCQSAWLNMVELTKLHGHANENTDRDAAVRLIETVVLKDSSLKDLLGRISSTYPRWDIPAIIRELTNVWHMYAKIFGVRFVTCNGGPDDIEDIT